MTSKDFKENGHGATTEAEVSKVTPGQAAQPSQHPAAPRRHLPDLQEPADGTPGLPGMRELSRPGGHHDAGARTRKLGSTAPDVLPFVPFTAQVRSDRALVFPGQGAQSVGMGLDLYEQFPAARELYDRADEVLGFKLSKLCFEGPEDDLRQTNNSQPAIVATSLALLKVACDVSPAMLDRPAFVAGHSLGEYSALVAAGAMPFEGALRLVRLRGELMQTAGEGTPGTMAAVLGLDTSEVEDVCREAGAEICNVNAPGQIVIGGRREAVVRAMDYAKARGAVKVIPLSVGGAFHSSLMKPAAVGMVQPIATAPIEDPLIPVIANCNALPMRAAVEVRHELVDQVSRPVQWSGTVDYLGNHGVETFIEVGPGRVLTGIIKRMLRKSNCINVNDATTVNVGL